MRFGRSFHCVLRLTSSCSVMCRSPRWSNWINSPTRWRSMLPVFHRIHGSPSRSVSSVGSPTTASQWQFPVACWSSTCESRLTYPRTTSKFATWKIVVLYEVTSTEACGGSDEMWRFCETIQSSREKLLINIYTETLFRYEHSALLDSQGLLPGVRNSFCWGPLQTQTRNASMEAERAGDGERGRPRDDESSTTLPFNLIEPSRWKISTKWGFYIQWIVLCIERLTVHPFIGFIVMNFFVKFFKRI